MMNTRTVRTLIALAGTVCLGAPALAQEYEGLQRSPAMTMQERPEGAPVGGSDQIAQAESGDGEAGTGAEAPESVGGSAPASGVSMAAAMRYRAKRIGAGEAFVSLPGSPIRRFRGQAMPTEPMGEATASADPQVAPAFGRWTVKNGRLVFKTAQAVAPARQVAAPAAPAPQTSVVQPVQRERRAVVRDTTASASQATARYRRFASTGRVERPGASANEVKASLRRALTEKAGDSIARAQAGRQSEPFTRPADEQ